MISDLTLKTMQKTQNFSSIHTDLLYTSLHIRTDVKLILRPQMCIDDSFFSYTEFLFFVTLSPNPLIAGLVLTQAASGLCAAGARLHEAGLLLCEGITRSSARKAEARGQQGRGAIQARKCREPS